MKFNYKDYIRSGKGRCDITKLLAAPEVLSAVAEDMADAFKNEKIDKVVALDALGFVFGTLVASKLNKGLVLMRKEGKLSVEKKSINFTDYTKQVKTFEIAFDGVNVGERVLIVDEWSETGSQLKAAISLIENCGGVVVGATCLNIDEPVLKDPILSKYKLHPIIKYE